MPEPDQSSLRRNWQSGVKYPWRLRPILPGTPDRASCAVDIDGTRLPVPEAGSKP